MPICFCCFQQNQTVGVCPYCGFDNERERAERQAYLLPLGATLAKNRYIIGQKLGQGGFGVTYAGYDRALNCKICVKEYLPSGVAIRDSTQSCTVYWSGGISKEEIEKGKQNFVKEARKASKLSNLPSVVKVSDVFYGNDTAYIIMEFIEGVTLKEVLKNGTLGQAECFALLKPVMTDLEEIHRRGIIHRDISPDNLMRKPDGHVMLLDMGAAKDLGGGSGQSSMLVTKRGFSPIEQYISGGDVGPWTDVYAMCATYYCCVKGQEPPASFERMNGAVLDLKGFTPRVAAVLEKGMSVKPERRIRSMKKLRTELEDALAGRIGKTAQTGIALAALLLALLISFYTVVPRLLRSGSEVKPPVLEPESVETTEADSVETTEAEENEKTKTQTQSAEELFLLGQSCEEGQNAAQALVYYQQAAALGSTEAMVRAGWLCYEGRAGKEHTAEAFDYWSQAAAAGDPDGMFGVGLLYYEQAEYEQALSYFLRAAELGSTEAMLPLGDMYKNALDIEKRDFTQAFAWYQRAAEAGNSEAQYKLGELYELGDGVEADGEQAFRWYLSSADAGYAPAMYKLASLYEKGGLVALDTDKAFAWYQRAAEAGSAAAMYQLGTWYYNGTIVEQNLDQAREWWLKAAEAGYTAAMRSVGRLYEYGEGVEQNLALAQEWYRRADNAER